MKLNDDQISSIVDRVVGQIANATNVKIPPSLPKKAERSPIATERKSESDSTEGRLGCYPDTASAIKAAKKAFWEYKDVPIRQRIKIIEAIREICRRNVNELSRRGAEETQMGRVADKIVKNTVAIDKTPGVEDLFPTCWTGDEGLTLTELAPFGVIGSIIPCTNTTETIICNGIGMIAGGNTVCFNPHPIAKKTSVYTIDLLNQAVLSAGGPSNLFTTVMTPTIQSAQQIMQHPDIGLLSITGGPAVVAAAMKSGKRVIGAGPGNPPVVVDETVDLDKAAKDIIFSSSIDNNIVCVIEKEIIALKSCADALKKALLRNGAIELGAHQTKRLEKVLIGPDGHPNKKFVGKDIQVILKEIGMDVDPSVRLAFMETGPDHPFAKLELLMPVIPLIRANDFEEAVEMAYQLEGGCFHTAAIHSKNIDRLDYMARKMNTSIFVKNGPAIAGLGVGGEGPASFTIASPTGEGVTTARHFTRFRRCVVSGHFRIV